MSSDSNHAVLSSAHSLDVSKPAHLSRQGIISNNDNSHNASCGNMVIVENSISNRSAPSSMIVPFNGQTTGSILPLSNKLKISHKPVKPMPKITVSANNLQRLQQKGKAQSVQKKNLVNNINDDLGNILDIPIIFAKDDDNLSNIDKMPIVTQATLAKESQERPKLSNTTKVVLISNKQDKLQQTQQNKLGTASTQTVMCSAGMSVQNLNHLVLQTRSQNSPAVPTKNKVGIPMENRVGQPTIKYTKIILAKRNPQNKKSEQTMIMTASEDVSVPRMLTCERGKHRYVHTSSGTSMNYKGPFTDSVLEIEDVIKTNIIERKYASTSTIDVTSHAMLDDDDCNILNETRLDKKERDSEQLTFNNADETPSENT